MTTNEIASLPDNYELAEKDHLPDLPRELFRQNSDWISIGINGSEPAASAHVRGFGGRSVFLVLFRDANGRQAGLDYIKQLNAFKRMFICSTNGDSQPGFELNPNLPQFPTNSQWALVRRMCVIDTDGRIQPTHVVESIQIRTYLNLRSIFNVPRDGNPPQHFDEFRMTRDSQADLVSIAQDARDFTSNNSFFSMGIDPFEYDSQAQTNNDSTKYQSIVLKSCFECHSGAGIDSVNTYTRFLSDEPSFVTTSIADLSPEREAEVTVEWKQQQFNWGLLQGLWHQSN
ncbi:MAG TPA: hypothetical protein VMD27_12805 [Candidatus Aquilonibacter sp.]|nr:hypothetical protein [Candidatus Aquilonibacter sp.]